MDKEQIPLSSVVAANALLEQGILPGTQPQEVSDSSSPSEVAEVTLSITKQANELPVSDERRDRVRGNAAERVQDQTNLIDSDAFKRAAIINGIRRAHRRRTPITSPAGVYYTGDRPY